MASAGKGGGGAGDRRKRRARTIMIQGTTSGAGKTTLVAALCRIFSDEGYSVAPFKSQNMSSFTYAQSGFVISRAQAVQAMAARCKVTPDLNPVLLRPLGDYDSEVFVDGRRHSARMSADRYYKRFALTRGIGAAAAALDRLRRDYDLVVIEGAGSPAEINLQRYDIANMRIAARAHAPVLLVSDMERGGAFAGLAGTVALVGSGHRALIKGFVLNRFRGDPAVLRPGLARIRRITGVPVVGTVPMIAGGRTGLPEEDSLGVPGPGFSWTRQAITAMNRRMDGLAETVKNSVDMDAVRGMIWK